MNKTRRLTVIALLAAISFVLMIFPQFPLIPGASFLKIDFSFVPVLLGALMLDLKSGYAILLLLSAVLHVALIVLLDLLFGRAGVQGPVLLKDAVGHGDRPAAAALGGFQVLLTLHGVDSFTIEATVE